jgi:hypothetical protein
VVPGLDAERGSVAASFSPDGTLLAVVAGRGAGDLTIVDVASGEVLALVADVGALQAPTWTSDQQIVFLTEALADRLELRRLDLGARRHRLVADLGAPTGWWLGRAR